MFAVSAAYATDAADALPQTLHRLWRCRYNITHSARHAFIAANNRAPARVTSTCKHALSNVYVLQATAVNDC